MEENKKTLEEMMLSYANGRYELVSLASDWMSVLKRSDDMKGLSEPEIIKKAIEDVVSGKVSEDEIRKAKVKVDEMVEKMEEKREQAENKDGEFKPRESGKKSEKSKK